VIELSCGITFNIFSSAEIDKWIDASVEALWLSYNQIWKPRSGTANTAPSTGIKWKKNQTKKRSTKIRAQHVQKSISKNGQSTQVQLMEVVSKSFIKNNFNFKNCINDLIKSHSSMLSSSILSR
jgi:hypothetical protein